MERARAGIVPDWLSGAIAVLQLLYTEATAAEWLFTQKKATLHGLKRTTSIGEQL
jgi:hypothetical protein